MDHQLESVLDLCKKLYDRRCYREAWEGFREAYQYTQDKAVAELLLEYYYNPNKDIYQKRYMENKRDLAAGSNVYSPELKRNPECDECEEFVLWEDENGLYYLKGKELRQLRTVRVPADTVEYIMYANIRPEYLPASSKCPFALYYSYEILNVYMQISDFKEAVQKCEVLLTEAGLKEYLEQNKNINVQSVYGIDAESAINWLNEAKKQDLYMETRKTYGSLYSGYIFYVIRIGAITSSLGPMMLWVLKQLNIMEEKGAGYIPVIDFSYFLNGFLETDELEKINPWEYYFEQPTHFSLQAAYHAQNVILGNADVDVNLGDFIDDSELQKEYIRLFEKYIHISKRIEKKISAIYNSMIRPEWKVLGVVFRGTDYRNRTVPGEHRQPGIEDLIAKTKVLMQEWGCDHVFLATEDKGAVEIFKHSLGDQLVYTEKERYDSSVMYTQKHHFDREFDRYLKGEEYLTEIYILSKCNCLLSGRVGILSVALPMNAGKYENKYIYDLGTYTEEDYMQ